MSQLLLRLFLCAFFVNFCACVYVYVEEGKRKSHRRFPYPVIDGYALTMEKNIDVLEFTKLDENEGKVITLISNFPELKYINISYLDIEKLPKFLNLPKAEWMQFSSNKLTKIPFNSISSLPLIEISFSGNQITTIADEAFGKEVTELNLDCNLLTDLSVKWFKNPGKLVLLGLQSNQIVTIDENFFHPFKNLSTLNLSHNKILSIGNGAFSTISTMKHLNFQANQISVLQPEIFGSSINITTYFNIGRNRLNYLSKDLLKKLILKQFIILGNPWQCPCLRDIEKWMSSNMNDTTYETYLLRWEKTNPVCIMTSSFSQQCDELVDEELYKSYAQNLNIIDDDILCKYIV